MARPPASSRFGLRGSIAFRLAVGYGLLLAASMATLSAIVYFGTVGVFEHSIDNKIMAVETHLADAWVRDGRAGLVREIDAQLHDLIDTDTEVVGLVADTGLDRRTQHEVLATVFLVRGLTELAADEWIAAVEESGPDAAALAGLAEVARLQGLAYDARTLATYPHGRLVHYAGIVICRQRPGTAAGVTFMTLEDETGFVNLVVWQPTFRTHARLARTEHFVGVTGRLQIQDGVLHLIATTFWRPAMALTTPLPSSRDFH